MSTSNGVHQRGVTAGSRVPDAEGHPRPAVGGERPSAAESGSQPVRADVDARQFRDTLAKYPSGVTVISSVHEDAASGTGKAEPVGFTCQAFYSVSLEPPLVSFSVMTTSTSYPKVRDSGRFVVNVLAEEQRALSDQFARSGTDKWAGVQWAETPGGLPAIEGTMAWIECEIWDEHLAGDHFIVIGKVTALGPEELGTQSPLIFYDKAYRQLHTSSPLGA